MTPSELPDYEAPPVNEVVAGVQFEPLVDLMIPHIGLFWQRVMNRFPKCDHAPFLGHGGKINWVDRGTQIPLPRVWLLSSGGDELIQLQNDRFNFNWRQTEKLEKYPKYSYVIQEFFQHYRNWYTFVTEVLHGQVIPLALELSYINVIPVTEQWKTPGSYSNLFADFSWIHRDDRYLQPPSNFSWQAAFPVPGNGNRLLVSSHHAKRISDGSDILRVEISARADALERGLDESKLREWFDSAHEWIVRGFADLFQSSVQTNVWKRTK